MFTAEWRIPIVACFNLPTSPMSRRRTKVRTDLGYGKHRRSLRALRASLPLVGDHHLHGWRHDRGAVDDDGQRRLS